MSKILLFIPTLSRGGAERVMSNLANQFSEDGNEVNLVLFERTADEYPVVPEVKKYYIDIKPHHFLGPFPRFIKKIRAIKPDIALAFMGSASIRLLAYSLCFRKLRKFVSLRNVITVEYNSVAKRLLVRLLFPMADGVILQTKDAEKWFEKNKIRIKSRIIPNQVSEQFFDRTFSGQRKNIVAVGRLSNQKNHKLLITAFSRIAGQTDENLLIYGAGELESELNDLIESLNLKDRVFLMGLTDNVPDAIIGSRLFVLPSDYEGSPNALLEAIALGIPSISTDCPCGGPGEIIEDGKNGFLVPVGDADALAEKMLYALSLPDVETNRISLNAKASAERYRPEVVFNQWKDFLIG